MNAKEFTDRYLVSRTETNSLKWDALDVRFGNPDLTAMWVADMEFKTPEAVVEAMTKRVEHGVYGYSIIPESYFEALNSWHERRHGSEVKKEWVRFAPGVVNAIYWLINAFTEVNDAVLIVTPVYYPFHNAVKDTHRNLIRSELIVEDGKYRIDFEDFENKIKENDVKMFIQCSPHNPAGRVWTEEELEKILEICEKYHVLVITDEIHQDIIIGDKKFIPASIIAGGKYKENMITLSSASKTFNLACLLNSHIIIYNELLRKRYDGFAKVTNQSEVNIMGMVATEAAYTHGEEWLEGLLDVIRSNKMEVVVMNGLEADPSGYGKIIWDPVNKKAILHISNLPKQPSNKDYQLWVIRDKKPVDAGLFQVSDNRSGGQLYKIDNLVESNRSRINAFAVTLEPKGGVPQPTGKMYLLGSI